MGRSNKYVRPLNNYTRSVEKYLSKSESLTSHVLISYLLLVHKIRPWHIIPQPNGKRGIIDFFYIPEKYSHNVFIELKKHLAFNQTQVDKSAKYLKMQFPEPLKQLGRNDGLRLLIVTDLNKINVSIRRKEWGNSTKKHSFQLNGNYDAESSAAEIARWLKKSGGEIGREIVWNVPENKYKVIWKELKKKHRSELFKVSYERWLKLLSSNGGKGWQAKYFRAFASLTGMSKKSIDSTYRDSIKKVFKEKSVKGLVKSTFVNYGVRFSTGPVKSIFDE